MSSRTSRGENTARSAVEDVRLLEVSTPELDDVVRVEDDYQPLTASKRNKNPECPLFSSKEHHGRENCRLWCRRHGPGTCRAVGLASRLRDRSSSTRKQPLVDALTRPRPLHGEALRSETCRRSSSPATGLITRWTVRRSPTRFATRGSVLTAVFDQNLPDVAQTHRAGHLGLRSVPAAERR